MAVDTTTQIVGETPEIEAYRIGLLKSAKDLADQGVTLPETKVAGFTGLQDEAFAGVGDYYGTGEDGTGIAGYQPYLDDAGSSFTTAGDELGAGIASLQGLDAQYDPSTSYQEYMDPYLEDVVQQQYLDLQRQGDIQRLGANFGSVGAGAFGGSRQGIQQAEMNRNVLDQQARTGSQLRSAGYQNAQQQAQAAFENAKARQGQLGDFGIRYAQARGDLGTRQAALGELDQSMFMKDTDLMYSLGGKQQAQQQAELEAQRSNQMAQLYEPYQRLGFLSDIYSKTPTSQQTISQTTSPSVSPFQQYLGLGIAGLSAGAGAAKAGLFG